MPALDKTRQIRLKSPLGENELLIVAMSGSEQLGRMFEYELDLYSLNESINIDDILGQNITVYLELPDGSMRHFNGFVSRFSQIGRSEGGYATYEAVLRPWLWFLTRTNDCRIFQEKAVPDIIKEIFGEHGFSDYEEKLNETYRTREYCVQYRESDFNFVSRLMEEEGIYYYFKHEDGKHTLIISDSYSSHEPVANYEEVPYYPPGSDPALGVEHVSDWFITRKIQPGAYALTDYDFKRPGTSLKAQRNIQRDHAQAEYEVFDYPGKYVESGEGDQYARVRIEELHVQFEQVEGTADARGLMTGGLFKLTNYFPREDQNREYLITGADYDLTSDEYSSTGTSEGPIFNCRFKAIESKTPFRTARQTPKPFVQGPQTAMVVGPAGEEIYPDEHGRIKVQFHWDRYGKKDENSSCWVRVVQSWAGGGWGAQFIPRLGQEVMVEFLEGDPDRPIVTGRVYNGDNKPPYALPDNKTQSGVKSRSTKGGAADNFNEIRFEDKKGSEELYIQAEKDHNQLTKNDRSETVGHDRSLSVGNDKSETISNNKSIDVGVNHTETIGADKTLTVGANHKESIGSNMTITIGTNLTENVAINYMENVGAAMELNVGAIMTETIGANKIQSIGASKNVNIAKDNSVSIGKNKSENIGDSKSETIGKDQQVKIGKTLTIDAGDQITIKTGKASITMKKDGTISIQGKDITINGSGAINVKASKDVVIKGKKILEN